jgi:putative SOS response-associated peptidase YedK
VPILRNAVRSQRCLIIADGFFLWQCTEKKSQPVWLHPAADPSRPGARSHTIAFAGVTARHRDDGQPSFAIVVGPASPLALPIAPAIPPHGYAAWLTGPRDRDRELLGIPPEGWRADPVSSWVNSKNHDDPRCVEPIGNPAQGELF